MQDVSERQNNLPILCISGRNKSLFMHGKYWHNPFNSIMLQLNQFMVPMLYNVEMQNSNE